mgnify:CR=1 FL=1
MDQTALGEGIDEQEESCLGAGRMILLVLALVLLVLLLVFDQRSWSGNVRVRARHRRLAPALEAPTRNVVVVDLLLLLHLCLFRLLLLLLLLLLHLLEEARRERERVVLLIALVDGLLVDAEVAGSGDLEVNQRSAEETRQGGKRRRVSIRRDASRIVLHPLAGRWRSRATHHWAVAK